MSKTTKRERQKENRERARVERERMMKRDRQMKTARSVAFLLVPVVIIALIISAVSGDDAKSTKAFNKNKTYTATIETSEGTIVVALDAKKAPKATERFVELADKHYYDGKCFDRIAKDFVIQGGSPKCDQKGGEGHSVVGEVPADHYPVGSLAAAKTGSDPSGTFDAQFFVVTGSKGATLPNDYARFGTVTAGLDVAQKIEAMAIKPVASPTDGAPVAKVTIKRIRITVTNQPTASTTTTTPASSTTSATTAAPTSSTPSSVPESSTTSAAPSTSTTAPSTTTSSKP